MSRRDNEDAIQVVTLDLEGDERTQLKHCAPAPEAPPFPPVSVVVRDLEMIAVGILHDRHTHCTGRRQHHPERRISVCARGGERRRNKFALARHRH